MTEVTEPAPGSGEPTAAAAAPEKLNFAYVAIVGLACGIIAPFTALAWPFAMLTGFVVGKTSAERLVGIRQSGATIFIRYLAVTGGVIAMLIFGAIVFGLVSFAIVALVAFAERMNARTSATDQMISRIALFVIIVLTWIVLAMFLNLKVNIGGAPTT
jgi:hypothetical protein